MCDVIHKQGAKAREMSGKHVCVGNAKAMCRCGWQLFARVWAEGWVLCRGLSVMLVWALAQGRRRAASPCLMRVLRCGKRCSCTTCDAPYKAAGISGTAAGTKSRKASQKFFYRTTVNKTFTHRREGALPREQLKREHTQAPHVHGRRVAARHGTATVAQDTLRVSAAASSLPCRYVLRCSNLSHM